MPEPMLLDDLEIIVAPAGDDEPEQPVHVEWSVGCCTCVPISGAEPRVHAAIDVQHVPQRKLMMLLKRQLSVCPLSKEGKTLSLDGFSLSEHFVDNADARFCE